jgi:hypothetical protein
MLPILGLSDQLPASVRMMRGALSAQQRHRAQALYGFHSDSPVHFPRFSHHIFCFRVSVIIIISENHFSVVRYEKPAIDAALAANKFHFHFTSALLHVRRWSFRTWNLCTPAI